MIALSILLPISLTSNLQKTIQLLRLLLLPPPPLPLLPLLLIYKSTNRLKNDQYFCSIYHCTWQY